MKFCQNYKHPNIIQAKELLIDEALGNAQLILEYCPGQTLEEIISQKGSLDGKIIPETHNLNCNRANRPQNCRSAYISFKARPR